MSRCKFVYPQGLKYLGTKIMIINPRTTRGGVGTTPPLAFFPYYFLMIPTGKIASVYLLLGIEDIFWHM